MTIDPIQIQQIGMDKNFFNTDSVTSAGSSSSIPFKDLLTDAVADVKETANVLDNETLKLATGQTDDLHDITIASTKYSMAVDLFVQIRNKTLDSFNQLMNMNV